MLSGSEQPAHGGRHAVYLVPEPGSALASLGSAWLGRDVETGAALSRPRLPGIEPALAEQITKSPRFYGFHGTLKPPFRFADGVLRADVLAAVRRLAAMRASFPLPALTVAALGRFIALVTTGPCPDLDTLAAACVRELDGFRAPAAPQETEARRAAGLSARQAELLERWGYPYVLDQFRFHLTLTGPVADDALRDRLVDALAEHFAPVAVDPGSVKSLAVLHQSDRRAPFRLIARAPLLAPAGAL